MQRFELLPILLACFFWGQVLCEPSIPKSSRLRHRGSSALQHELAVDNPKVYTHDVVADSGIALGRTSFVEKPGGKKAPNAHDEQEQQEKEKVDPAWKAESKGTKQLRKSAQRIMPWLTKRVRLLIYTCIFYLIIFSFFASLAVLFLRLFKEYREMELRNEVSDVTARKFAAYIHYRFAYWFNWTAGAHGIVLVLVTTTVLFMGAFVYNFFTGQNIVIGIWNSVVWLVAPDAGAGESTVAGAVIGCVMSVCGLVIFALLLTLLQDAFAGWVAGQGTAPIVESMHTILIGLTDQTMPIVQQLCTAHESTGGTTIVVLSDQYSKEEMEAKIQDAECAFLGSRVIVRTGQPWERNDLEQVSARAASTIVLMADHSVSKEQRDAFILQVLVTLRSQGWPLQGKIVAVCSLLRNFSLLERIGGTNTEVVMLDRFAPKFMVQCSAVQGISKAVSQTLGFNGSELYIKKVPDHIVGLTFANAAAYYPKAVLVGTVRDVDGRAETTFCPHRDYVLNNVDDLVLIAENSMETAPEESAVAQLKQAIHPSPRGRSRADTGTIQAAETIVIVGWNEIMAFMMLEIDVVVTPGTKVYVLAPQSKEEREQYLELTHKRNNQALTNICSIEHIEGPIGSRYSLDELHLPFSQATRIFILSDENTVSAAAADRETLATILQIREIFRTKKEFANIPIIPQIMDPKTALQCSAIRSLDFMDASGLPSQILAMIAYDPRIAHGLEEFLSEAGHVNFQIEELSSYCDEGDAVPEMISFFEASSLVRRASSDVMIAWSLPHAETEMALNQAAEGNKGEFHCMMSEWCQTVQPQLKAFEWLLNPQDKCAQRSWTVNDRVVVLSTHVTRHESEHASHGAARGTILKPRS